MRPLNLVDHPFRGNIRNEVHARPVEIVRCPSRIRRVAAMLPNHGGALQDAFQRFSDWCCEAGLSPPAAESRQHAVQIGERRIAWELHTEFVTLTWTGALDDKTNWPEGIGLEALGQAELVAAVRIDLLAETVIPKRIIAGFGMASLCVSSVEAGQAQVATDFVADQDGFTRFELAAGALAPLRLAVLVRRLLEIETYRSLALLGLPLAREVGPEFSSLETGLGSVVQSLVNADDTARAQSTLTGLHSLSVRSGHMLERTGFRFAACHAYGDILHRRLASLGETAILPAYSLSQYLGNRIDPALATCLALEKRQALLAQKIHRATEMLDTRIGLDIQAQTQNVLTSIAETATSQFRLQRTVEGLSTIAISYYLLGILSYVFAGVGDLTHLPKSLVIAAVAPVVVFIVWVSLRAVQGRH